MRIFEIQCGKYCGTVKARDEFSAWRKVVGDADDGFAPLARFRERPGVWNYCEPRYLDMAGR